MKQSVRPVIEQLLEDLAESKGLNASDDPSAIITTSLDQMRFLVSLEDRLDIMIELGDEMPFKLHNKEAFLESVEILIATAD